jgi:lipopolysaccharide biosynthesis protein
MVSLRTIAIHLPQFHPNPENNNWWGKGFTEWTNVTKATPLFKDHYQPHLPADLGFYDLRLPESRLEQEALAKEYGIYGFCYYHYWFNGKRVLHEPVQRKLANSQEDLPFMLCWANEDWTRRWYGQDDQILLKQDYSANDDLEHIKYLIPFFKDPRYIRINGRPVIAIYRSTLFPDMAATILTWRQEAAKEGLELYICRFETFGSFGKSYMDAGFDAGIEFPPMNEQMHIYAKQKLKRDTLKPEYRLKFRYYKLTNNHEKIQELKQLSKNRIDYGDYIESLKQHYTYPEDYTYFPGVCPSWDNTARNRKNPFIFLSSTPDLFKEWLLFHRHNYRPHSSEENFIFINAWNEWAEGNHLEPCRRWGTGYLEAVREVFGG